MVDLPRVEVVLVEEVAERSVPNVVEQAGDAHRLLDQSERRGRLAAGAQSWVKVARPLACQVHGTQGVLEARVLSCGEHPPRALKLVDATQALQPG